VQSDEQVDVELVAAMQAEPHQPVVDVPRAAPEGDPPVEGAQWDEVHRRWEVWDAEAAAWVVVGDDQGSGVAPDEENPLPPQLAREVQRGAELEAADEPPVPDVDRVPEPETAVPGAQWNEVEGRWERWDEAAGAWVPVEG
jgi:hypothetical protein